MTTLPRPTVRTAGQLTGTRLPSLTALFRAVPAWLALRRSRQSLGRLDAHMLRDIGLDRQDAADEAEKPFWRF